MEHHTRSRSFHFDYTEQCGHLLRVRAKYYFGGQIQQISVALRQFLKPIMGARQMTPMTSALQTLLFPGDLGYYDNTGRFYFVDRIKDLIKCQDGYVSPMELEDILRCHSAVQEACVVGIPHPTRCDDPTAFVVLNDSFLPSDDMADELKKFVEGRKKCLSFFSERMNYGDYVARHWPYH